MATRHAGGLCLCVFVVGLFGLARAQSLGAARILEQAGQFERALQEYRQVLEATPGDFGAYQGFQRMSRELARFDSLEAVSDRLARLMPDNPRYVLGRIDGLLGLRRRKEALGLCRSTVEKWPQQAVAVADVLESWAAFGEAAGYLLKARQDRADPRLHADRLITLYELEERYVEAAREIVLEINARTELLGGYLAKINEYARKTGAGPLRAEFARIADPWTRARATAEVYLALGREPEALNIARQALDRDGLYGFAHECEDAGAFAAALAVYQEQGLRPDQARVLRKLGRNKEALELLSQENSPAALYELAEIHRLENHNLEQAAAGYERVLKARPGDEPAVFGLASSQVGLGRLEETRQTLGTARRVTDRILLLTARVFLYRLDTDSARHYALELSRRFPESPLANDGLELALVASGGENAFVLARAMYEAETGAREQALGRCTDLAAGTDDVAELAWFLKARIRREAGEFKQALAVLDSFGRAFPGSPRRARQLMVKADIFLADLKDENKYRQMLEEVAIAFPGSAYAPVARSLLDLVNRPAAPGFIH